MVIGQLKSKIEKKLTESYSTQTFSNEIKKFKKLVLENKNIAKLFFIYDELSTNKGLNEDLVFPFIMDCTLIYENTVNKIDPKEFLSLRKWVSDVETDNVYKDVDNLFSNDVLNLENRVISKKVISERLMTKPVVKKDVIKIPLSASLNIVNKTIKEHISILSEDDRKELVEIMSTPDSELRTKYGVVKENTINKLNELKNSSDSETSSKIEETIEKIKVEDFDRLNYYRLKNLFEGL